MVHAIVHCMSFILLSILHTSHHNGDEGTLLFNAITIIQFAAIAINGSHYHVLLSTVGKLVTSLTYSAHFLEFSYAKLGKIASYHLLRLPLPLISQMLPC